MATIGRHYLAVCCGGAHRQNIDTKALMAIAGIAPTTAENHQQRIADSSMTLLLNSISKTTQDTFLGFANKPVPLGFFQLLMQSLFYCQNLAQALKLIKTSFQLVDVTLTLNDSGDRSDVTTINTTEANQALMHLEIAHNHVDEQHFLLEYLMVFVHRLLSWLVGGKIPLERAQVSYTPTNYQKEFTLLFRCPLAFQASSNALVFPSALLESNINKTRKDFEQLIEQFPLLVMRFPGEEFSLSNAVRQSLINHFKDHQSFLNAAEVANILNISGATLRRKLASLGTNFGEIKSQVRQSKALELLSDKTNTTEVIALLLGYSEARAFSRVFKQWTGMTPSQYRRLI